MLVVLSPAKSLDYESEPTTTRRTTPRLRDQAQVLAKILATKTPDDLQRLMNISNNLAELNFMRFQDWEPAPQVNAARQASFAYSGDVYIGLDPKTLDKRGISELQKTVRILSGLYGVLRPLDAIMPHRLEMGTRLANPAGANLYHYWSETVTNTIIADLYSSPGPDVLINLASKEYFDVVDTNAVQSQGINIVTPVFLDSKDGQDFKVVSFFAKRARGALARYIIDERLRTTVGITRFEGLGYSYDPQRSTRATPTFTRVGAIA